jgi:hypothetical protein
VTRHSAATNLWVFSIADLAGLSAAPLFTKGKIKRSSGTLL